MRVRRPDHTGIALARQIRVVGKTPAAGQQPRILAPPDRLADPLRRDLLSRSQERHRSPVSDACSSNCRMVVILAAGKEIGSARTAVARNWKFRIQFPPAACRCELGLTCFRTTAQPLPRVPRPCTIGRSSPPSPATRVRRRGPQLGSENPEAESHLTIKQTSREPTKPRLCLPLALLISLSR